MKILNYPSPTLKIYCQEIKFFNNEELNKELDEMKRLMLENNGMGLSHNQVYDTGKRVFVMKDLKNKIWEFLNPTVIYEYGQTYQNESCLSFPNITIQVSRPEQVSVKAFDRNGEQFHISAIGLEAICISHEIQHLNGMTFFEGLSRQKKRDAIKRLKK
jgi:peptide deformylase